MKIATFNVNSVKARLEGVLAWVKEAAPDVAALQELKCETDAFPHQPFEDLGYICEVLGQKTYNGVALISKYPLEDVLRGLPGGPEDAQARYLEATVAPKGARPLRIAALYLPNGNPPDTEKFTYKLAWMERLYARAQSLLVSEEAFALCGDYNVIPTADDVWDEQAMAADALARPESRRAFRKLMHLGLTDAFRACDARPHQYTFWDYQAGAYPKNHGFRIDHLLLSPQAADRLVSAGIDAHVRGWERPSDHVPVWCEIAP
ncbi:MAG TPA: exodeoxyribonuclease III [Alphaproteobacteria bacterium]|nr:exodeoxyribonuclease III [Alphaproteobacteria bacterium]